MFDVPMPTVGLLRKYRCFNEEHSPKLRQQRRHSMAKLITHIELFNNLKGWTIYFKRSSPYQTRLPLFSVKLQT
jgi:hypothetical protein